MVEKELIKAYFPGKDFPSVSLTGYRCDQMCEHCRAIHLKNMVPVSNEEELLSLAQSVVDKNGAGMLISGGCDVNGVVPVSSFINSISKIPESLKLNMHAGFIDIGEAKKLHSAGVDCFSVDIHQDQGVINSVLHLDRTPEDYSSLLDNLIMSGVAVIPHITVGFGYNDLVLSGQLIRSKNLKDVVLLTLVPTKGTAIEESVLTEDAIIDSVLILKSLGLNVILGCMRDRSLRGLEKKCISAGVRRIANPSPETITWAKKEGFDIVTENFCCSL